MTVMALREFPDPLLSKRARPLTQEEFDDGTADTIARHLADTMVALEEETGQRALGLSAPQIGWSVRMFRLAQWPGAFCNPELVYDLSGYTTEDEACFSLPGVVVPVARAIRIRMRYFTVAGGARATKMRDRDARTAQHEFDHLDGLLIINRADGGIDL